MRLFSAFILSVVVPASARCDNTFADAVKEQAYMPVVLLLCLI